MDGIIIGCQSEGLDHGCHLESTTCNGDTDCPIEFKFNSIIGTRLPIFSFSVSGR